MELFQDVYTGWRETRIRKVEKLFGKEFFKDKEILELGCGYGDTGKHFIENLGAKVTFAEGDPEFFKNIQSKNPNSEVHILDQDNMWNLGKKFDIVIHWGVLYHLKDWQTDLKCTMDHADLIFLESEVSNYNDSNYEFKYYDHDGYDQALNGVASRPSAAYIEKIITNYGFNFVRFDDVDLNFAPHTYDWKVSNVHEDREHGVGRRRFWILKK